MKFEDFLKRSEQLIADQCLTELLEVMADMDLPAEDRIDCVGFSGRAARLERDARNGMLELNVIAVEWNRLNRYVYSWLLGLEEKITITSALMTQLNSIEPKLEKAFRIDAAKQDFTQGGNMIRHYGLGDIVFGDKNINK